jgi:hypothetical protein
VFPESAACSSILPHQELSPSIKGEIIGPGMVGEWNNVRIDSFHSMPSSKTIFWFILSTILKDLKIKAGDIR